MATPSATIHVRLARSPDLPTLADLATEAFFHTPIDLQFFPRHILYPTQYRAFFLREFKMRLASPNQIIVVAEVDNPDPANDRCQAESNFRRNSRSKSCNSLKEAECMGLPRPKGEEEEEEEEKQEFRRNETKRVGEIVGYAAWIRFGPFQAECIRRIWPGNTAFKAFSRLLLHASGFLSYLALHTQSVSAMRSFHVQATTIVDSLNLGSWVELSALAVKADWQRKGIGGRLVDWGLAEADSEGVATVLESTGEGVALYEKKGFRRVGEVKLKGREVVVRRSILMPGKTRKETVEISEVRMPVMLRAASTQEEGDIVRGDVIACSSRI